MINAITDVVRTYPGWTMFCIVVLVFAVASRIDRSDKPRRSRRTR